MYDPGAVEAEIEVGAVGDEADRLVEVASDVDSITVTTYEDLSIAQGAFSQYEIEAIALVEQRDGVIEVSIVAPSGSLERTVIVVQIRSLLEALERDERTNRQQFLTTELVSLPPAVSASPYFGFTYAILIPILVLLPVFLAGAVVVDSIVEELEHGTLEILRVTPTSLFDIVSGKAGLHAGLVPAQVGLWIVLLEVNGFIISNPIVILLFSITLGIIVVILATVVALSIQRRSRAQLTYSFSVLTILTAAAILPEHPATTIARLSIDSATVSTFGHVLGFGLIAIGLLVVTQMWIRNLDTDFLA